jgi:Fe/S biogenesis protein NfuA
MSNIVEITESAEEYLGNLLKGSEEKDTNIRIFVSEPGSNRAETCIIYCKPGEQDPTDFSQTYSSFIVYLDEKSLPYLEDAKVDYHPDKFGGQLTIRAPKSKTPFLSDESSIEDKINFYLQSEINPALAAHGGEVSLVEVLDDNKAVLQFGGGCQGCSMIDVTLKDGVEKTLIENVPEITGIIDSTDHSHTENAYFK